MNESGVMNFFTQVMVRHGVVVAMLAVVLLVVLLLTAYYVKNQIDAAKLKAATEAAAVAAREAELRQARQTHESFMQGLVREFQDSNKQLAATLQGIEKNCNMHCSKIQEVEAKLDKHAEDSTKGRGVIHARLNTIQLQIAGVRNLPSEESAT